VSVAPDQAQIDGGVTSDAKTAREASEANNAAMGKVLLALKGAGIDEKDYQTSRPVAAAAVCRELQTLGARRHRQLPRQQPCHGQDPRRHQGRERDRRAGRRRRQRHRRHQFHGTQASKHLDEARERRSRTPAAGRIYAKAAGVTLASRSAFSEEGAPRPVFRGKMAPMAAAPRWRKAKNAIGDGERDLGDQGGAVEFLRAPSL
jgi:uncharacterized protein YggE